MSAIPRRLARLALTIGTSASYGAMGIVLLVAGARWTMPESLHGPVTESGWTDRARAAFTVAGFYDSEVDASGQSYSWTGQTARIDLSELNRARVHQITVSARSNRSSTETPARVRVAVDGISRLVEEVSGGPRQLTVEIPRRRDVGAIVTLDVTPTLVPGSGDPRALGVMVDGIAIAPVNAPFMPSASVLMLAGFAVFATVLGMRFCGVGGWLGVAASLAIAAVFAWFLLQDGAFLSIYPKRLAWIGGGSALAGAMIGLARVRWPAVGGAPEWGIAAGLLLAATALKLGLFWHPLAPVADGMFHVHRAELVHRGHYFFTSVTPKPFFELPYPVALYRVAQPFWHAFPTELDRLRLLRAVCLIADALVGIVLYGAVRRQWTNRTIALLAVALWAFAAAPLQAVSNANLTNAFGQSLFAGGLAGVAWLAAASRLSGWALVLIGLCLLTAFLSHFGTALTGVAILVAVGAILIACGTGRTRRVGAWTLALLVATAFVAWVVYYSHFTELYAQTWTRLAAHVPDDSSKIVAAPSVKVGRWWAGTGDDYGRPSVPVLLVSISGMVVLLRRYQRDGVSLVVLAWILAWIALSVLGLLTPIVLRANLAAAPAFIVLCAIALGTLMSRSRTAAFAGIVLALVLTWDAWAIGVECLRRHTTS